MIDLNQMDWERLQIAGPQLITVARAAEKVARFDWGGDAPRTAAMHELRVALEGLERGGESEPTK